jgi:hypothetical protein
MTLDYNWIILVHEYVFMDMVIVFHVSKRKKINLLKPNGTYMYHLLQQYVSLRFVFIGFVLFPL